MSSIATPAGPLSIAAAGAADAQAGIRLSLVVPTYNEIANIGQLLRELAALLDGLLGRAYEIIVVDDDSPDGTSAAALALASELPALRVMRRRDERGLSTAVIRGWQAARGEVLAVIDGDLQHPPQALVALWERIVRGADLAVASRHIGGGGVSSWALWRRMVSRSAQLAGLLLLPGAVGRVSDPLSGYLMIRRDAVQGIPLDPLGYKILVELLARCRPGVIAEVPYVFRERAAGHSKLTPSIYADYLRHLVRLRGLR